MILQALVDYYESLAQRAEISALGWCPEKVSFALNISLKGELLGLIPLTREEQRGKKIVTLPQVMEVPERVVRAGKVIRPNFLCDNSGYILGFENKGNPERAVEYFMACAQLHTTILEQAQSPASKAIIAFFAAWNPEQAQENPVLQPYLKELASANLVFWINGEQYAHKDAEIKQRWQSHCTSTPNTIQMRCLVTQQTAPVAILHGTIKGVFGAQAMGTKLISYNDRAYESYGKDKTQGLNAPVSEYAAFAYVTALNHLLADSEHKRKIGDTTVVYWAEAADPVARKVFSAFAFPTPDTDTLLAGVMNNLAKGKPVDGVDLNKQFYVLGLAPNAARLSVRFFLQSSFGKMLENLSLHYQRLEITKAPFEREFLSVPMLLAETVNPYSKDKASSPLLSGAVMRSVLTGARYPQALYQAVLGRVRAEQDNKEKGIRKLTSGRVGIIKAYLLQQNNQQETEALTVSLNPEATNRAYVLGRLFAVLENAQLQAIPGIKTTIKNSYFTSASSTPSSIFPRLLQLSSHHINKLKEKGKWVERDIQELMDKLNLDENPFPTHFQMNDQGIFILGYYHQAQTRYNKKEEA